MLSSNTQRPHQLKLMWNGHTKSDFEAIYQEAQDLERLGKIEDAEIKFREALTGFEKLLSATHDGTTVVAYRLASFYAQTNRMKDADTVLDWITEKHIERFGNTAQETIEHHLRVVDMFCNWSRNKDAEAFLCRIIDVLQIDIRGEKVTLLRSSSSDSAFDNNEDQTRINLHQRQSPSAPMPTSDSSEPVVIDHQLRLATGYIKTNDKAAKTLLLSLIEKCEKHPERLASQILQCRSALLGLYHTDDREKMNETLDQSKEAFWKLFDSEQEKTQSLFDAGKEIAKWHVKAGKYSMADDMFIQIQSDAVEAFSADERKLMLLFQSIGLFYQSEGRWDDAEPWFEQALVACYRAYEKESIYAKRLEAALENHHYEMYSARIASTTFEAVC